ncbi:hypothetical protein PR202_ga20987 [Eleusine coracana subsp. coracana]|uniref:Uncharacterized protein n=1 Tax=Eleusine coracana subsp. coracana TaxID=191504 RepID=A0AAV5D069_ELECO|nr:hypothetical protein PR202_ga20987 [Eleusine coracana subsp. coracana]
MDCSVVSLHGTAAFVGHRRVFPRGLATEWHRRRLRSVVAPLRCSKMYVPGFGEGSPEKKAAINLQHFFNYLAVRIVLAQLEVAISPWILIVPCILDCSYNREAYFELKEFVSRTSLDDADVFCKKLIRESPRLKGLAMRILETDFEWDNLKKLSFKMVDEANTKLMREYVLEVSHIEDQNYKQQQ